MHMHQTESSIIINFNERCEILTIIIHLIKNSRFHSAYIFFFKKINSDNQGSLIFMPLILAYYFYTQQEMRMFIKCCINIFIKNIKKKRWQVRILTSINKSSCILQPSETLTIIQWLCMNAYV